MVKRFHTFRAPTHAISRATKRNSLPLPSVSSRKVATRFMRDVTFGIRSMSRPQLIAAASTFALVILFCCLSTFTRDDMHDRSSHPVRSTDCACPFPRTSEVFVEQILAPAGFVAKVRMRSSTSNFLVLDILELYRGHVRAVQWPLLVHERSAAACYTDDFHDHRTSVTLEWLVAAGGISFPSARTVSALPTASIYSNFSMLVPEKLKGPRCDLVRSNELGESKTQDGIVWMTPWENLSTTVAENIVRDFGNEPLWWRANDATLEFKASVWRTVDMSGAKNPNVLSHPAGAGVAGSGSEEWWVRDGVSVIAACKDRTETLQRAILSWLAADGVNEIVVVDWSSEPSIRSSFNEEVLKDPRLVLVRADGQSQWILSRAYNLAVRFASFSRIMKVDCDTVLTSDFFTVHELKHDRFFAGDWRQLESGSTNALHTNGLLFVNRDDFLAIGGFDERITTYGWDDSDLAERLSKVRNPLTIAHDKVRHISHSASLRVTNQPRNSLLPPNNPFAAAVEIQRNRLLLTKYNLPVWRASSSHVVWNVHLAKVDGLERLQIEGSPQRSPVFISVKQVNDVAAASSLVSDADAEDVAKRSIRLILHRLGLPLLPKTLTFDFYKSLITKVANPDKYAEVVLLLRGGCISKLLSHITTKGNTSPGVLDQPDSPPSNLFVPPPYPYIGWRLEELWLSSDTDCSCGFSSIFDATDEEILSKWLDSENHIETMLSEPTVRNLQNNITVVLRSFSTSSVMKNVSANVAKWYQNSASSRILAVERYCSTEPVSLSPAQRKHLRESLQALVPSKIFLKGIRDSLATRSMTILDSPLLDMQRHSNLISNLEARRMKESLTSTESEAMFSRWILNSFSTDTGMLHSLKRRAHAVLFSAYVAKNGWDRSRISDSNLGSFEAIIVNTIRVFESLFAGCQAPPYDYIEAYPELALIIAGFFSARLCL